MWFAVLFFFVETSAMKPDSLHVVSQNNVTPLCNEFLHQDVPTPSKYPRNMISYCLTPWFHLFDSLLTIGNHSVQHSSPTLINFDINSDFSQYPLVNIYTTTEHHFFFGKSTISMAICKFTRGSLTISSCCFPLNLLNIHSYLSNTRDQSWFSPPPSK